MNIKHNIQTKAFYTIPHDKETTARKQDMDDLWSDIVTENKHFISDRSLEITVVDNQNSRQWEITAVWTSRYDNKSYTDIVFKDDPDDFFRVASKERLEDKYFPQLQSQGTK